MPEAHWLHDRGLNGDFGRGGLQLVDTGSGDVRRVVEPLCSVKAEKRGPKREMTGP